jgi:hypothetical protein
MRLRGLACLLIIVSGLGRVFGAEVPPGTVLEIRLLQPLSSYTSKPKQRVHAVLIAPVESGQDVLLPAGTQVFGSITGVHRVGLGLIRERARLDLSFDDLVPPEGPQLHIASRVTDVANAREKARQDGTIRGIRATSSFAYRASGLAVTVSTFDPLFMLFAFASSSAILRFPDSEIYYPAGTELKIALTQALPLSGTYPTVLPPITSSPEERQRLADLVAKLPFRTRTLHGNKPSDLTNLLFVGSENQIERAFAAAGWSKSQELNVHTRYEAIRAMAEERGYAEAPMSVLTLEDLIPHLTYEKSLNTIEKRHHLRIWDLPQFWQGQPIWTASSTQDIGVRFSRHYRTFIHLVDHRIDRERSKVVNDLVFSNCVSAVELVDRPDVPREATNATDEPLLTDGRIAVLRLNACDSPTMLVTDDDPQRVRSHGNLVQRGSRQFVLTLHNDLIRGNVAWQAVEGTRLAVRKIRRRKPAPQEVPEPQVAPVAYAETGRTAAPSPVAPSDAAPQSLK